MRISRLLTLSLTIVLFTLGGLISPENTTLAHHCRGAHKTVDCGSDGDTGKQTTYDVEMRVGNFRTGVFSDTCTGTATARNLGPNFAPNACMVSLTDETYGMRFYCLNAVSVKNTNKGTKVMLFMARDCIRAGENNYHTLSLVGHLVLDTNEGGPDFQISVDVPPADGADLTKINQPDKNVALDDTMLIDPIVYTEIVSP